MSGHLECRNDSTAYLGFVLYGKAVYCCSADRFPHNPHIFFGKSKKGERQYRAQGVALCWLRVEDRGNLRWRLR